jgi:hypothetical protein
MRRFSVDWCLHLWIVRHAPKSLHVLHEFSMSFKLHRFRGIIFPGSYHRLQPESDN